MSTPILVEMDPDLAELAPAYLERKKLEISQIVEHCKKEDFQTIRYIGHKLKGNAALFSLPWLGEKGSELEAAAQEKNSPLIENLQKEMNEYLKRVSFIAPSGNTST